MLRRQGRLHRRHIPAVLRTASLVAGFYADHSSWRHTSGLMACHVLTFTPVTSPAQAPHTEASAAPSPPPRTNCATPRGSAGSSRPPRPDHGGTGRPRPRRRSRHHLDQPRPPLQHPGTCIRRPHRPQRPAGGADRNNLVPHRCQYVLVRLARSEETRPSRRTRTNTRGNNRRRPECDRNATITLKNALPARA